jgi:proline iminopeptidase
MVTNGRGEPGPDRATGRRRVTRHGLFTDIRGDAASPPLLFLHGGPGQGCHEFMEFQGDLLASAVRLVGFDQRGVDRSEPLPEDATLTIADLIADCEELRQALGIERWAVLGHSFGGSLALRYAAAHPAAVTAVIFENAALDLAIACRTGLRRAARLLTSQGHQEAAETALAAAAGDGSPRAVRLAYKTALAALDDREAFFLPDPATRARMRAVEDRAGRSAAEEATSEASSERHQALIEDDDACYEPLLPLLPKLEMPALLITGGRDTISDEELRSAFRAASPANQLIEFPEAGHFAHADEPAAYAAAVITFLSETP